MKKNAKLLYNISLMQHRILHSELQRWEKEEKKNYNAFEVTDAAYALREMIKFTEDTLKQLRKMEIMAHAKVGVLCMNAGVANEPVETEYCTARMTIKQIPDIPKLHKDPERYKTFMDYMKIPQNLIDEDMIRLNWKPFVAWMNKRIAAGYPTPKGLDLSKIVTTATLAIRKRKEIEFVQD